MAIDFEEKYLLVRDENTALKKKKNEQEATIKRMYTKLAMIEEAMKKKRPTEKSDNQEDAGDPGAKTTHGPIPMKRDLDTEKFIQSLKSENMQLRKKAQTLLENNRHLQEQMRQHQLKFHSNQKATTASRTNASLGGGQSHTTRTSVAKVHSIAGVKSTSAGGFTGDSVGAQTNNARKLQREHLAGDLEAALKNRLVVAERQLVRLQQENEQLRAQGAKIKEVASPRGNNHALGDTDDRSGETRHVGDMDVEHMTRELRDRQAQVAILTARYENLEDNVAAEREIQEKTLEQLEHMNRQVHKLRTQLQDALLEKEELELRIAKNGELDHELTLLRQQNRKLEERMTALCESPFINDAFQRKERIDKIFELEKHNQQLKATNMHAVEENRRLQANIQELQGSIKLMKQAKDMMEQDKVRLQQQLAEERNHSQNLAFTPRPIAFEPPQPREEQRVVAPQPATPQPVPTVTSSTVQVERRDASSSPVKMHQQTQPAAAINLGATTIVSRSTKDPMLLDPLPSNSLVDERDSNVKHLRNRVHVLQVAHLKSMQELERCERMLYAQTNINRELALEVEELTMRKVTSTNSLQKRMKELELIADERQQRIQQLEAQIRQLKYAREKMIRAQTVENQRMDEEASSSEDEGSDVASVPESLVLAAHDLSPGEQLLEIWIVSASYDRSVVTSNSSTFLLCDFYDFESQSTPLLMGNRPDYNFSASFKVTVDAFFLRYLASESLSFELYQAVRGDFRLIGRATVPLSDMLKSKGVIKEPNLPVKLVYSDGEDKIIGSLSVALRFAAPISEIWRLHLRSFPQDIQLLTRSNATKTDPIDDFLLNGELRDGDERLLNELQISVFACRGLRSFGRKKATPNTGMALSTTPSSYVHYQLLGFPDVFTNIVPTSSTPEFDLAVSKQFFAVEVDACLLRFFSKFRLWFTVFDDQIEMGETSTNDGVIGRCGVLLEELVKGESMHGWFPLVDRNGHSAGEISILVEWKDPFQVVQLYTSAQSGGDKGRLDLHSLNYDQQHAVMAMFSPDMDGRVNYRQFLHYAIPSEAMELATAKIKEKLEYAIETEQILNVRDLFLPEKLKTVTGTTTMTIPALQEIWEKFGVFLSSSEEETLESIFGLPLRRTHKKKHETEINVGRRNIMVHFLLLHINPRLSSRERLLLHKVRHTIRGWLNDTEAKNPPRHTSPAHIFERYDPSQSGYVSRGEFKRCLSILGFELLNVDNAYTEFVEKEARHATRPPHTIAGGKESSAGNCDAQKQAVDLDEADLNKETYANPGGAAATSLRASQHSSPEQDTSNTLQSDQSQVMTIGKSDTEPPQSAISEFEQRKRIFRERIKAIAASSSRSIVYENLDKRGASRSMNMAVEVRAEQLRSQTEQRLAQLHTTQPLHHDAARTLQRQFRNYQTKRTSQGGLADQHLVSIDAQLRSILKTWTSDELGALEIQMVDAIEAESRESRKHGRTTRKQFGFMLSKIPRLALEPALLHRLMETFSAASSRNSPDIAYRPLIHFICSVSTEPKQLERPQIPALKILDGVYVNAAQALSTFRSVGDMKETGQISIKRFRECLRRLSIQLTAKDFRILVVLFDSNGIDLLFHAFLHLLQESKAARQIQQVLARCKRFGISRLREKLLIRVNNEDGSLSREDLHSALMAEAIELAPFDPQDSYILFEMAKTARSVTEPASSGMVSIDTLILMLEKLNSMEPVTDDTLSKYNLQQLRSLAQNSRKMLCPPYSELVAAFERYDWKEAGVVTLTEFVAITPSIGFLLLTDLQVKQIARHFGVKTKGSFGINYRQFLEWCTPIPPINIEEVEYKLRQAATVAGEKRNGNQQVAQVLDSWRKVFVAADIATTGFVTRSEFAKIVNQLQLPLSTEELRFVLFSYDRNLEDQVDYNAFVHLNWKETSKYALLPRKQVQFSARTQDITGIITKLQRRLESQQVTCKHVSGAMALFGSSDSGSIVNESKFLLTMKQLGAIISMDDAHAIFEVHGSRADKSTLDLMHFASNVLGLANNAAPATTAHSGLCSDDEERLTNGVTSALKYSPRECERAILQLNEFCVVHDYGDISPRTLWKHLERNGMTTLFSKKGVGLLIQKFTFVTPQKNDGDQEYKHEDDDQAISVVSLRGVSDYLAEHLRLHSHQPEQTASAITNAAGTTPPGPEAIGVALSSVGRLIADCDAKGIDLRGRFEEIDTSYTGYVTALQLKNVLSVLKFSTFVSKAVSAETAIGLLVRQFRRTQAHDAVSYVGILTRASALEDQPRKLDVEHAALQSWCATVTEHLRARIRTKAGLSGAPIQARTDIRELCQSLDSSFSHFDRAHQKFLSLEQVQVGLRALSYEFAPPQLECFMSTVAVYRHHCGAPSTAKLSRMEFDAFVLDPYASRLLHTLAQSLGASSGSQELATVPRIAELSRTFIESEQASCQGTLPLQSAWAIIEGVLNRPICERDRMRLKILFDVSRSGQFAYKLFLKVMSQWRTIQSGSPTTATSVDTRSAATLMAKQTRPHTPRQEQVRCSRDALLRSLYNQLSSLDFDSQVDILEEYLRRKDWRRSGSIKLKHFIRIAEQIGLSLSKEAIISLEHYFLDTQIAESKHDGGDADRSAVICYRDMLTAIKRIYENEEGIDGERKQAAR